MESKELAINLHRRMARVADAYRLLDEVINTTGEDQTVTSGCVPPQVDAALGLMKQARDLIGRAQAVTVDAILAIGEECWPRCATCWLRDKGLPEDQRTSVDR